MAFTSNTLLQAWERSGGTCECMRTIHNHSGICNAQLVFEEQGKQTHTGWQAFHIGATFDNSVYNCEIICWECQKQIIKSQPTF